MNGLIATRIKIAPSYEEGGLVSAADGVRSAGRNGDDMLVHINQEEFQQLIEQYGEPTINPETGLPEFFLGKVGKFLKKTVLPAVLGAGLGFLTGGPAGLLAGGAKGVLGSVFGGSDENTNVLDGQQSQTWDGISGSAGTQVRGQSSGVNPLAVLGGLASMIGQGMVKDKEKKRAEEAAAAAQAQFNAPLPEYNFDRQYLFSNQPAPVPDATREGEQQYFSGNNLAAGGQPFAGFVEGSSDGRADNVEANLSEGEYVFDAETVSLLGNGNNAAGADRLDEMRAAIRAHKGGALASGKISPDAMSPLDYLR